MFALRVKGGVKKKNLRDEIEKFKNNGYEEFDNMLRTTRVIFWNTEKRFKFIMWIMIQKDLKNVYKIQTKNIKDAKVNGIKDFSGGALTIFKGSVSQMVNHVFSELNIDPGPGQFKLNSREQLKVRTAILEKVPEFPGDESIKAIAGDIKRRITEEVPLIVERLKIDIGSCKVVVPKNRWGVVYVIVLKLLKQILYIGSTSEFESREYYHTTNCYNKGRDDYNKELYVYFRENNISFKTDVEFIPIMVCQVGYGFETHLETAVYDLVKGAPEFPVLINSKRPVENGITLDTITYAYDWFNINENDVKYIGTSTNFFQRETDHHSSCYNTKTHHYNSLKYQKVRELNETEWPDCIKIRPIEKFPYYMRNIRENHLINLYDTIKNGWNKNEVPTFDENGQKHKIECQYCHKEYKDKSKLNKHINLFRCTMLPLEIKLKDPIVISVRQFVSNSDSFKVSKNKSKFITPKRLYPLYKDWSDNNNTVVQVGSRQFSEILRLYTELGSSIRPQANGAIRFYGYEINTN